MIIFRRLGIMLAGFIWLCLVAAPLANTQTAPLERQLFHDANQEYKLEHYESAVRDYEKILRLGVENSTLYYNLGNALFKSGKAGEAVWAYLKAGRYMPRDPDVKANLDYAKSQLRSESEASVYPNKIVQWITLDGYFSTVELSSYWMLLLYLASALWALCGWWIRRRSILKPLAVSITLMAGIAGIILITQYSQIDLVKRCVVVADFVNVRFAPQEGGTTYFSLPEGAVVLLLQEQSGWSQVRRSDSKAGWVKSDSIKML